MLYAIDTPNSAGVAIYGDKRDFEGLYNALHIIVGEQDAHKGLENVCLRVLAVCYELRHALLGNRGVEFVDNGMDEDKMRRLSTITSAKNVYLRINVLWPEMLFLMVSINELIQIYARNQAKNNYNYMMDKRNIWDGAIIQVRLLQTAVAQCLQECTSETSFSRMMTMMNKDYTWLEGYTTQYVDLLNCKFLAMGKEKRLKSIPGVVRRLTERGDEYLQIRSEIMQAARQYKCAADDIEIGGLDYPAEIDW